MHFQYERGNGINSRVKKNLSFTTKLQLTAQTTQITEAASNIPHKASEQHKMAASYYVGTKNLFVAQMNFFVVVVVDYSRFFSRKSHISQIYAQTCKGKL